ncbi:hypothetical protein [Kribbella sp. C-35]|uniref:hypothetical protein n=1 Tax=Kribbella sp. C-35 TaxID=2789276 RepID=UPI00397E732A
MILGETVPEVIAAEDERPRAIAPASAPGDPDVDQSQTIRATAHLEGQTIVAADADVARAMGTVDNALAATGSDEVRPEILADREQMEEISSTVTGASALVGEYGL